MGLNETGVISYLDVLIKDAQVLLAKLEELRAKLSATP